MKNVGNSSRGRSHGVPKIFKAPMNRTHCAVIFAIAQLSCIEGSASAIFPLTNTSRSKYRHYARLGSAVNYNEECTEDIKTGLDGCWKICFKNFSCFWIKRRKGTTVVWLHYRNRQLV